MDTSNTSVSTSSTPNNRVYDTVAAFAAELVRFQVTDVVLSPGSRSTPLALCLDAHPHLKTWVHVDERSAGFFALGQARYSGLPSILVCTSGTAAANYLPAVIEAHHGGIPLIVCTADRPPELRGWGAAQTIDQVKIYGTATRWAFDLAGEWNPVWARVVAQRAVASATASNPGPVHLNWPFREPLEPTNGVPVVNEPPSNDLATSFENVTPGHSESHSEPKCVIHANGQAGTQLADLLGYQRGLIVVGPGVVNGVAVQEEMAAAVLNLSEATSWPIIGEPLAGVRRAQHDTDNLGTIVPYAGHFLGVADVAKELRCDVVLRLGDVPITKSLRLWLESHPPAHFVLLDPANRWHEPSFLVTRHVVGEPIALLNAATQIRLQTPLQQPTWLQRWRELDSLARKAVVSEVVTGKFLSAQVTKTLVDNLLTGSVVMVSNSMPARLVDAFVDNNGCRLLFVGNRGANGIDGIISTAAGLASAHNGRVVLFTGDLALLHDLSALFSAAHHDLVLTVVCINNNGGGIFSTLPIATGVDEASFERLFRTPHGFNFSDFNDIAGVRVTKISNAPKLLSALSVSAQRTDPGVDLLVIDVDPGADLAQMMAIADAVGAAVS